MKVIPSPTISVASASRQPACPPVCALSPWSQRPEGAFVPRAAAGRGKLGFSAASQRLAQRRLALLCQEEHLSAAMQFELSELLPASHAVSEYWQGCQFKPMPLYKRKIQQYRRLAEADQERSQLTAQDQFEPHDLDGQLLEDLRQQLQHYPIGRAELVKKTLRFFPEQPLYVLLVAPHGCEATSTSPQPEPTLGTQIAQELCFRRELLVCLTPMTEPLLVARIQAVSQGNLLD